MGWFRVVIGQAVNTLTYISVLQVGDFSFHGCVCETGLLSIFWNICGS